MCNFSGSQQGEWSVIAVGALILFVHSFISRQRNEIARISHGPLNVERNHGKMLCYFSKEVHLIRGFIKMIRNILGE